MSGVRAAMLREIDDQPALWRRVLALPALAEAGERWRGRGRLHLIGCGDMHFAARAVEALCAASGELAVRAWSSFDLRWSRAGLGPGDLAIGASISGRTPRTVEALALARRAGADTLALTDEVDSAIARAADSVLCLETAEPADLHRHVYQGYASEAPQTRTHTAVLLAMLRVARGDEGLAAAIDAVEAALPALRRRAVEHGGEIGGRGEPEVIVLGSGPQRPTAMAVGAKFLEFAIASRWQCFEEFHHLEMFVLNERSVLVAVIADEDVRGRWREVEGEHARLGARSVAWDLAEVGLDAGAVGPVAAALGATVAGQLLAFETARALGRDVERWVGGVRTALIYELSGRTIRASEDHSGTI